jgi:hypothetical protein
VQDSERASLRARAFEASASNSFLSRARRVCKMLLHLSNIFLAERNLQDPGSMDPFTLGKFGSPCSRACMDQGGKSGQTKPVNNY